MKKLIFIHVLILISNSSFAQVGDLDWGFNAGNIYNLNLSGKVGIGTQSPAEALHINGSLRGNQGGALRISTGNGYVDIGP